ncbi:MAG: hypothetical protein E7523_11560 [Ruminococcaceae bacterium]|nr:hypothetical protein [Oscillospiraceae bacterium]
MTERERFIKALRREPIDGHCPTFELVFYLTLEAIGKIHPSQQRFDQWKQMSKTEQKLHMDYMADSYIEVAEKYHHSAIFVHPNPGDFENTLRLLSCIREKTGDKYFLMMHGDCTFEIPNGENMLAFSERMYEDEEGLKKEAQHRLEDKLRYAEKMAKHKGLLDGFALCSDYCFNVNPFFSPSMFETFIAPYLAALCKGYRDMGFYTIKHTDGNIMPILDQMVQCGPDALHSLDPQGGVDLATVKKMYGDKVALCGNVNCGLLQTGTQEEVIADVRRCLRDGMDGWGFVFCTSNCAYTGLPLERYELMNRIWWDEGIYG